MEHATQTADMLEKLMCPAFSVTDGIIKHANHAALQRQVELNSQILDLISIGAEEYGAFTDGKLCLSLCIHDITYNAAVSTANGYHLFCLESDYEDPELRAFALAAQQLREPLSNAMAGTELLLPNSALKSDNEAQQYLSQVNRSLHQLLRAISNMSDTAQYASQHTYRMQLQDAPAVFEEILEKASAVTSQTGRTFTYDVPQQSVYCLLDREKLERAVLNLISNAVKFTPKGGVIHATLRRNGSRLAFTVQDSGQGVSSQVRSNIFSGYLREPGIDDGRNGIGLGMSIVRSVAAAHGGTVLMEQPKDTGARITMTLALRQSGKTVVRSPISLPVDYTGGRDQCLLELSDVLPDSLYLETF